MKNEIMIKKTDFEIDSMGREFKEPVEKRVKKSKFAKLLAKMTDEEIKAFGYCVLVSPIVKEAIECMSKAVEHSVQIYALQQEYEKRTKAK